MVTLEKPRYPPEIWVHPWWNAGLDELSLRSLSAWECLVSNALHLNVKQQLNLMYASNVLIIWKGRKKILFKVCGGNEIRCLTYPWSPQDYVGSGGTNGNEDYCELLEVSLLVQAAPALSSTARNHRFLEVLADRVQAAPPFGLWFC